MAIRRELKYRLAFYDTKPPKWAAYLAFTIIIVLWEAISRSGLISPLYLPAPTAIIASAYEMTLSGELISNLKASLTRVLVGFSIGSISGIILGLFLGVSRIADASVSPLVYALYPIPKIALLPLIILWLGIGEISKIMIIALGVFFPVLINTYAGVKGVESLYIKVALSFKTSRINMLKKVIIPGALPVIFAGLKLGAGTSLLLLVAAEMIAAKEGIGAMVLHYGDLMLTTKLMVGVVVLSLLGITFNQLLKMIEKRIIIWRR